MNLSKTQKAILALITANLIWGAAAPIFKWSLSNIQPFTLAFFRFFIATYLLAPFIKNTTIKKEHFLYLFLAALSGVTLNISFFFLGLEYSSSVNAPIIASSGPILLLLAAVFFLREKPKRKVIYGMLLSLLGVIVIIIEPLFETGVDTSIIGNIFFLLATLGGVVHTIFLKKLITYYEPLLLTFWTFFIGSVLFLPMMLSEVATKGLLTNLGVPGITGIIFGALLCSALAYSLSCFSIKYMDAGETGIFTYMDPIVAVLIAIPLLGETLTYTYIFGTTFVFLGLFVAEGRIQYQTLQRLSQGLKSII
jgi:drug/metabolite transporter (DMT)-like permease